MATRMIRPRILKGTRDHLPNKMIIRQYVIGVIRETFERFGFEPLETPAIEMAQTLEGKYGEEGEQLIYKFTDRGARRVGLRYDLTVPFCRVVAMYPEIVKPFKRYQMQPVWRADKPRKGRYREFWQCDADVVGSGSMLADAEILNIIYATLTRLGLRDFKIRLNNRKILNGLAQYAGVPQDEAIHVLRAIDKMDKIGLEGVRQELLFRNDEEGSRLGPIAEEPGNMGQVTELVQAQRRGKELLATIRTGLAGRDGDGAEELREVARFLERYTDVPDDLFRRLIDIAERMVEAEDDEDEVESDTDADETVGQVDRPRKPFLSELAADRVLELIGLTGSADQVLGDLRTRMGGIAAAAEGIKELEDIVGYLAPLGVPATAYQIEEKKRRKEKKKHTRNKVKN